MHRDEHLALQNSDMNMTVDGVSDRSTLKSQRDQLSRQSQQASGTQAQQTASILEVHRDEHLALQNSDMNMMVDGVSDRSTLKSTQPSDLED